MVLKYQVADIYHRGSLGAGLGPYWNHFYGNGDGSQTWAPVLTLYGSYFISEPIRIVAFDATTMDSSFATDFGVYLSTEYTTILDKRLVVNLLLGAHAIAFVSQGQMFYRLSAPQGLEVTFTDFLKRGSNVSAGLFLYPLINGVSYYNTWIRWGSPKLFYELNYISWDEPIGPTNAVHSDNFGFTLGTSLFRFL
jgi:hypothetical protein